MIKIKNIMDRVFFALSVPTCVCCKRRLSYGEKAFCPECYAVFEENKNRNCARCARKLDRCDCTNDFLCTHFVKRVLKSYRYINRGEISSGNALIYSLKKDNRSDVLDFCTEEMVNIISAHIENPREYIITNVPRRKSAIIEYGIDHSAMLAKSVAKSLHARYIPLLGSKAKEPQKSLETIDRLKNADFYIAKRRNLTGKSVIIIDDIITSGASVGSAAALVRSLGSKDIVAVCLAIAYKDDN